MLATTGCFIIRSLKLSQNKTLSTQCRNFSVLHKHGINATMTMRNNVLSRPGTQKLLRRHFKVKNGKTDSQPRTSRVPKSEHPPIKNNNSVPTSNFWRFAIKFGAYTIGFTTVVFGGCALWQQHNMMKHQERFHKQEMERKSRRKTESNSQSEFVRLWKQLPMVNKVAYGIIGANLLVWTGWKTVNLKVMMKWFTLSLRGSQKHFSSMFLSTFSHKSFIHFYVNMYVLSSFCVAWDRLSMKGNTNTNGHERFLAFYLSAGMYGGLLSILVKSLGRIPHPSLGASGAIMGLVGYVCEKMPDTRLGVVFVPSWTFSAHSAKNFIIAFDAIGLIIGALSKWRYIFFDHAGHLGGIIFGIWYAKGGDRVLDEFSRYVMRLQHGKR